MSIFSALQELGIALQVIQPVMTNDGIPVEEKRKTLCSTVDSLSEDTFKQGLVAKQIIIILNMKEDVCKEYGDTAKQVDGILEWLPRMKKHRGKLEKAVKKNRKKYGLNT